MAKNGRIYLLKKDGNPVIALVSNDIENTTETMEVASHTQGIHKEFIAGHTRWSMKANCLVMSAVTMASLLQVGQVFSMTLYDREHQKCTLYGDAIMNKCNITMQRGALVQGYFELSGTTSLIPTYEVGDFNNDFNNDFYNI